MRETRTMSDEIIHGRHDGSSEHGGKWSDSEYDGKAEPTGFTDWLDSGYRGR